MTHRHDAFIRALGGTTTVAEHCGIENLSIVSNWRRRGISWPWRFKVCELAAELHVDIPEGFLDPAGNHATAEPLSKAG